MANIYLQDRINITRIAQILQPRQPLSSDILQDLSLLHSPAELQIHIQVNVHLEDGFLGLDHAVNQDSEVRQVVREIRVFHLVVAGIAVDRGSPFRWYCTQFYYYAVWAGLLV